MEDRVESAAGRRAFRFLSAAARATHLQPYQFTARFSLSPEISKTCWRQFCVADRVLDVAVAEISQQGSGVVPLVGER
jgi:hypothetical protein